MLLFLPNSLNFPASFDFSLYRILTVIGKAIFFAKKHFSSSLFKTIKIAVVQYYRSSSIYLDFYFEIVDFNLVLSYIYVAYAWFFWLLLFC